VHAATRRAIKRRTLHGFDPKAALARGLDERLEASCRGSLLYHETRHATAP
jgi:hypothetical protein